MLTPNTSINSSLEYGTEAINFVELFGNCFCEIPLLDARIASIICIGFSPIADKHPTPVTKTFENHKRSESIRTGFISGTSVGGMDLSEQLYIPFQNGDNSNNSLFGYHSSGTGSVEIAKYLGLNGYVNTISTACSSATNAILMGARMIRNGILDRVVVGGTDSISEFTVNGFSSLMIYDEELCKPFDDARKGINLGEGAAYLVLESEKSIAHSKSIPLVRLSGWGCASDAFHQTASSPEGKGAVLAMQEALDKSELAPSDINYINAHGTATPNNDLSESVAFKKVFGENIPAFSSTKGFTGHTLAASGAIEAVLAVLAIQKGYIYPNLNYSKPIQETQLIPVQTFSEGNDVQHVLSNSFGFGGNNSSLIFSVL